MLQEYENKYTEREEKEEMFAKEKGGLIYQVASVYSNAGWCIVIFGRVNFDNFLGGGGIVFG